MDIYCKNFYENGRIKQSFKCQNHLMNPLQSERMNMNLRSHVKIFVLMMVCIFASAQAGGASFLEQCLNYDSSASNETIQIAAGQGTESSSYDKKESGKTCWMNTGKAHKHLGYGTLLMAAAAGVSGGDKGCKKTN
jgi:hypothetical protein